MNRPVSPSWVSGTAAAVLFAACGFAATPPNTGQVQLADKNGILRDVSYTVISDTTGSAVFGQGEIGTAPASAYVVSVYSVADGWAGAPGNGPAGANWIAPDPDQSSASRGGDPIWKGTTTYQMSFVAYDGADIGAYIMADDTVLVKLTNANYPSGRFIANFTDPTIYTAPGFFNLCSRNDCSAKIATGVNTIQFVVNNSGGPTGLNVAWVGNLNDPPFQGVNTGAKPYHLDAVDDPVDGATGQYYYYVDDLKLGGALGMAFSRYYSSALSGTGFQSGLGLNWMSNFDIALSVSGSTAKALLFGGKVVTFTASGGGWQLQSPPDVVYQLVAAGSGYKLMDPTTKRIFTFSPAGALTTIEDRNGNALTVTPSAYGPTSVSDGQGRTLTFTYTRGFLSSVQDQGGRTITFTRNGDVLLSSTDPFNGTTKYTYFQGTDGYLNGLMAVIQLPAGNTPVSQTYDGSGRVVTQTDANGHVTKLAYDGAGGTTITSPLAAVTKQANDASGELKSLTDANGGNLNASYDGSGRRASITDNSGHQWTFTWHAQTGYPASMTDGLGNTTTYTYTAQAQGPFTFYNLTAIAYADGTARSWTYDGSGNRLSVTLPGGASTKYTYDSAGRLLTVTQPGNAVSTLVWNSDSTLASITSAAGSKTQFVYDALKRVTKATGPNGGVTAYAYDAGGARNFTAAGPVSSESNTTTYDADGRTATSVSGVGGTSTIAYTGTNKFASYTDPLSNKTIYAYDVNDRLSSMTDATGVATTFAYDTLNRLKSVSTPSGTLSAYTYTADGYIASMADGAGNKTAYTYDALGRLTALNTPAGTKFARSYDKLGRLASLTGPLGDSVTLARDANGNLTQVTAPGGISTSLGRGSSGLLTSITSPNGNTWAMVYDGDGKRTQFTDPLGNATFYAYTGDQLTQVTYPLGTVALTNDADGRPVKRQYSDGSVVNSSYDANGLLASADSVSIARDLLGQPKNINGIGITFDAAGRLATLTYATGKVITYTYISGRLTSIADWVGGKTTLTYDSAGSLASLTYPNGIATTYSRDVNGRLTKLAFGSLGSITLTLDAAGKITAADRSLPLAPATANLSSQQYAYNAGGQLNAATSDKMGRVTSQGSRTYTWNLASQLTAFQDGSNSAILTYDGLGGINTLTPGGGSARSFVVNYLFRFPGISIVRQGGTDLRYYVYLPDGRLLYSIESNNARHFYHFDEAGNTVMLTGDNGAVTDSYGITPYGDIADHTGTSDNPFTWQGQYGIYQEGAALYYMRNRHYDASAARFLTRDPRLSTDPRSSEPYTYANGNPLLYQDPLGSTVYCFPFTNWCWGNPDPPPANPPPVVVVQAPPALQAPAATPPLAVLTVPPVTMFKVNIPGVGVVTKSSNGAYRVVSNDGGSIVSHDGGTFTYILPDGSTLVIDGNGAYLIGSDGAGLIGSDGAGLIGSDGAGLIGELGGALVSDNGAGIVAGCIACVK